MSGFRNSSKVDSFAVGMEFEDFPAGERWRVVHVPTGWDMGLAVLLGGGGEAVHHQFGAADRPGMELGLSSIWEGREYLYRGRRYRVVSINDRYVTLEFGDGASVWDRAQFEDLFTPVPLEPTWAPKVGDEVLASYMGNWKRATVRWVHKGLAAVEAGDCLWVVLVSDLKPVGGSK